MPNLNTSAEVKLKQSTKSEESLTIELERANRAIKGGEMVEVYIPEAYRGAFGDPCTFSVNAVSVSIPIGKRISVPAPHASHLERLMKGAVLNKRQRRLTPEEVYND